MPINSQSSQVVPKSAGWSKMDNAPADVNEYIPESFAEDMAHVQLLIQKVDESFEVSVWCCNTRLIDDKRSAAARRPP